MREVVSLLNGGAGVGISGQRRGVGGWLVAPSKMLPIGLHSRMLLENGVFFIGATPPAHLVI